MKSKSKNLKNVIDQAEEAEQQMELFKKLLLTDLQKKGFNVTVVHDSIIISKNEMVFGIL